MAPPPVIRNMLPNGPSSSSAGTDASPKSTVKSTLQAPPRRKVFDEGKLRKVVQLLHSLYQIYVIDHIRHGSNILVMLYMVSQISGRLFSDSGPRRSTRLAGETGPIASLSGINVAGNGTNHSTKNPTGSKLGSTTSRSVTLRKGQSWSTENFNEGQILVFFYYDLFLNVFDS